MLLLNPMMSFLKMSLALLFLLCAASVAVYSKCRSVRQVDFRNRVYPHNAPSSNQGTESWRVKKGRYQNHEDYFKVIEVVYGDLTGDGKEEAAVVAIYGGKAGNFYNTDTYIFSCVTGKVKLIGILEQTRIEEDYSPIMMHESTKKPVEIRDGALLVAHYTDGSHASPDFITTFHYKMVGSKFLPQGSPMKRKIRY